ncbi:MAG: prepilin peptidase [Planctomycetaceae bacterium]|nr:prepilin peptidase [Planctomycetaceae bacterium]
MSDLNVFEIIFLAAIVLFTTVAAVSDLRARRIPNKLTAPMFVAGVVWQACQGWSALGSGLGGFAIGFGLMFVLWMIGSAGGGDVKLLGALSIWLGPWMTLQVLFCSLVFVVVGTGLVVLISLITRGWQGTRSQYLRQSGGETTSKPAAETRGQREKRRVMAFAAPVALATWCVLALFWWKQG